jgi:small GTP-binding protein
MSDIFLSYARPDRFFAGELAYVLIHEGWDVWWDHELIPGQAFPSTIEIQLRKARCVVAIWSHHSIASRWVLDETREAVERGVLIPVILDTVTPPIGLRGLQHADLRGWDGTVSHPGFVALARAIQQTAGLPKPPVGLTIDRKVGLLGASAVGKTSLVRRFVSSLFSDKYLSTIGVKIDKKTLTVHGNTVSLLIWDTEGFDDLRVRQPMYLYGMAGYLLVADGTRLGTLKLALEIDEWIQELSQAALPHIMLLNKADLTSQWAVDGETLSSLTTSQSDVRVVSAKSGHGVEEAFHDLSAKLLIRKWSIPPRATDSELLDETAKEEPLLRTALTRNPENFLAWARLAGLYAARNDLDLADKAVARAERSTPVAAQAHLLLGEELARSNRPREAVTHLQRAIYLGAEDVPYARLVLASLYLRLGSANRAREQYEMILAAGPSDARRREVESRLHELNADGDQRAQTLEP